MFFSVGDFAILTVVAWASHWISGHSHWRHTLQLVFGPFPAYVSSFCSMDPKLQRHILPGDEQVLCRLCLWYAVEKSVGFYAGIMSMWFCSLLFWVHYTSEDRIAPFHLSSQSARLSRSFWWDIASSSLAMAIYIMVSSANSLQVALTCSGRSLM